MGQDRDIVITAEEASRWLDRYKKAWEERDVAKALALFSEDVDYREVRFGPPLLRHKTLESYWRVQVEEYQRDIRFESQLWGVSGNEAVATWQADFHWLPINGFIRIDGILKLVFSDRGPDGLICRQFNEWFDYVETDSLAPSANVMRRNRPRGAES